MMPGHEDQEDHRHADHRPGRAPRAAMMPGHEDREDHELEAPHQCRLVGRNDARSRRPGRRDLAPEDSRNFSAAAMMPGHEDREDSRSGPMSD